MVDDIEKKLEVSMQLLHHKKITIKLVLVIMFQF
jgi:hypothetical protein